MTINVKGPDGSNFAFPDGTPEAEITGSMAKHYGDAAPAAAEPVTTNKVVRAAATGVPLVGGVLNKLNAATNATLAPVVEPFLTPSESDISRPSGPGDRIGNIQLPGTAPSWSERYRKSEAMQNLADEKFAAEHPVVDTAAKVAGGVAGSLPIMTAAPAAFGLTGTLPQMVGRGAASNAALSAADALIRGESPVAPAAVGGAVGAAAPLVARGAGAVARAVKDYRNPVPPVAQATEDIAGVRVPVNQTGDPAIEAEKEIMRRGARGTSAEAIAKQADDEARQAIGQAEGSIAASLDPTAAQARTAPVAAAEAVQNELAAQAAARQAAEAQAAAQVEAQGATLARNLGGGAAPVTPFDAAEGTGAAITKARNEKVAATQAAYKARDAVPGTFDESVPQGLAEDIRTRLNSGENPIWVDPTNESKANQALKIIDQTIGRDSGLLSNAAAPKAAPAAPGAPAAMTENETVAALRAKFGDDVANKYAAQVGAGDKPAAAVPAARRPVDLRAMDEARKRLVTMFGDAKSAAIRSGDKSDMRAMAKILNEFDNAISDALASGKFSGDAGLAKELQDAARKSHAEYRQTFSSRGPGDEIGRNVEKILGRYSDTAATPEEIAKMSYGPKSNPGTGSVVKTALRLRKILGENSPEWAQYKQGLFAYVDDASLSPAKRAARIDTFLNTSLAKSAMSADERAAMSRYSRSLRTQEPRSAPLTTLERDIARIDGTDGKRPATVDEVAKMITAGTGDSQRLLVHLKTNLTPEGFARVKQGIFDDLVNAPAGHNEYTALQKSKRLSDYLESGVSKVANTAKERAEMAKLASVYKRMVPLPGTTNPSGTAPMLAKVARKAGENILALIGLGAHGVSGAIVGHGLQKGLGALKDAKAGKEAVRLFYGKQARRPVVTGRLPQLIAPAAVGASQR
jgi:hypothetical protein